MYHQCRVWLKIQLLFYWMSKKVNELMTLCDNLKAQVVSKKITQQNLADVIIEKAVNELQGY